MNTKKSFTIFLLLVLFIVPVLTACGPQKVNVNLTDYKIAVSMNSVPAGDVAFHVSNDSSNLKHEFLIFKTDLAPDKLPTTSEGRVDEESKTTVLVFDSGELDPGTSVNMTQKLEAGNYVVVCNMMINSVAHYQVGMTGTFTVK